MTVYLKEFPFLSVCKSKGSWPICDLFDTQHNPKTRKKPVLDLIGKENSLIKKDLWKCRTFILIFKETSVSDNKIFFLSFFPLDLIVKYKKHNLRLSYVQIVWVNCLKLIKLWLHSSNFFLFSSASCQHIKIAIFEGY